METPRSIIREISDLSPSEISVIEGSGSSDSSDDNSSDKPLLERMLRYRKSDDDIFKLDDKDFDQISILSLPFSDEDITAASTSISLTELKKKLYDESNQFPKEHFEILQEMEEEKGLLSPPCSTCSLCSSCTNDTWELLKIDEDSLLHCRSEPLDLEVIEDLKKLNNEHSHILDKLLAEGKKYKKVKDDDDDDEEIITEYDKRKIGKEYDRDSDTMSGIWKMLSTYDDFLVTPPDYDYFTNEKSQRLYNNDTIPWEITERSRSKCTKWLNKYH